MPYSGSTAAITDEKIAAPSLSSDHPVHLCRRFVHRGSRLVLFLEKVPSGISLEKVESGKGPHTPLIMTGLLIIMFVPVFNSYKTDLTNASDAEKHARKRIALNGYWAHWPLSYRTARPTCVQKMRQAGVR